jgi:predicted deacylase
MPATVRRAAIDLAGLEVPMIEVTGSGDGPLLTVIAGVHGCEYAPMAAVRQWVGGLAERELTGTVRAVPVLNLPAFTARSPFVVPEDGKNLNRNFPGDPAGSFTERFADAVFGTLITGSDAVIDAHCGDLPEALEPFAIYDAGAVEERALGLALAYGLPYVIRQEPGPDRAVGGTSSAAAAEVGIPAIIAEAGGCGIVDAASVAMHVRGLDGVLAHLGMISRPGGLGGPGEPGGDGHAGPVRLNRFIWLRSEHDGWWEPVVGPGEQVVQGQLLGTVTSLDGSEIRQRIEAPAAGAPMFITRSPATEAGGLLLGLGA